MTGTSSYYTDELTPDVQAYLAARNYIDVELVRLEPRRRDPERKIATAREFNRRLGDPQAAYPSIQVAGTSGKGSVSLALARILSAAGLSTGLHVSPYLQVATEKTWIDGRYCSGREFLEGCETVRPVAEHYRYLEDCPTSVHGMASLALSYEVFRRRQIDWCVMETGVGGRFDLVQGLDRRLAVITDIGLDHIKTLGESRREIAWHKAGVMEGAEVAVVVHDDEVWPVFEAQAASCGCRLLPVRPEKLGRLVTTDHGTALVLTLPALKEVVVPWTGRSHGFPVRNACVAAAAADALAQVGLPISADSLVAGLTAQPMPGRLEQVQESPQVILDGAHNAQKMSALMAALPDATGRRHLVIGATGERHFQDVLGAFRQPPHTVTLTRPLLYGKAVADPREMAASIEGWCPHVDTAGSPFQAVRKALRMASPGDQVLVTGSLYLVGQARSLWYPWQEVLQQCTSWPRPASH